MSQTEMIYDAGPNTFYKDPVPLIFGNFPWDESVIENKDTYEYQYLYTVPLLMYTEYSPSLSNPSPSKRVVTDTKYGGGFKLFYSNFFKKWCLVGANNICDLFPYLTDYAFNPFVNDINGVCCWVKEDTINNSSSYTKVYYNTKTGNYNIGFGEDIPHVSGLYLDVGFKDELFITPGGGYANDNEEAESSAGLFSYRSGLVYELDNSNSSTYFTKDTLTDKDSLNKLGIFLPVNDYAKSYASSSEARTYLTLKLKDSGNEYFVRSDTLPDLDFESGEAEEEICGIYKNSYSTNYADYKKAVIGSIVLGDKNNSNSGKFIRNN